MNKITRYNPSHVMGMATTPYVAPMIPSAAGKYVKHESHAEIVLGLQRELNALKQMQKDDFFYHIKGALDSVAESAIKMAVCEAVKMKTQKVFKVDPAHNLTADMVKEMIARVNGSNAIGAMIGECFIENAIIGNSTVTEARMKAEDVKYEAAIPIPNIIEGRDENGVVRIRVGKIPNDTQPGTCVTCVKSEVDYFTKGHSYEVDVRGGVVYLAQDNHVSDLECQDQWKTHDYGAYIAIRKPGTLEPIVMFTKLK